MPRIPIYESQVNTPNPGPGYLQGAVQQSAEGPAMISGAFQGLGKGIDYAANVLKEKEDQDETLAALSEFSEFKIEQARKLRERQESADPGAPGFVDKTLEDYKADSTALLSKYGNKKAQQTLRQYLSSHSSDVAMSAIAFEAKAKEADQKDKLKSSLDNLQKTTFTDPSQFEESKKLWADAVSNSSLSPIQKAELLKLGRVGLASALWQGQTERRPGWVEQQMLSKTGFPGADDLDFDQRAGIARNARAERRRQEDEYKRSRNEGWANNNAQLRINIMNGDIPDWETVEKSYKAGLLNPATRDENYAMFLHSQDKAKKAALAFSIVQNSIDNKAPMDPKDPDQKKAANTYFDLTLWPTVQAKLGDAKTRPEGVEAIRGFVEKTTILPEKIESQIRADLRSTDPTRIASAADLLDRITSMNPRLGDGLDQKDKDLAVVANQNIRAGVETKRAIDMAQTKVNAADDPEIERRKAWLNSSVGKDAIAKKVDPDLADMSRGVFGRVLNWNFNATVIPEGLKADYQSLAEQSFLRTGDAEASRTLAKQDILKVWGRTEIGGDRWMKYAPENFYAGDNGNVEYIKKQLIRDVKSKFAFDEKTFNADKQIRLAVTPEGARAVDPKGNPAPFYVVQVVDGGVLKELRNPNGELVYWRPDWKSSDEYKSQVEKAQKRSEEIKKEGDDAVLGAQRLRQDNLSRDPTTGLPKGRKRQSLGDQLEYLNQDWQQNLPPNLRQQ